MLADRPRRPGPTVRTRVVELTADAERRHEDRLVTEEPLEIRLAWPGSPARRVWVTMRTPGHDFELAAGWLVHEGLVPLQPGLPGSVAGVAYCTDTNLTPEQEFNVVTVTLDGPPLRDPGHRHVAASSGSSACGVCGKDSVTAALDVPPGARWDGELPSPGTVRSLPDRLRESQAVFERTGGVHAAGLFTAAGEALVVREDVGRHNAVDKVTGARLLAGESPAAACLVVSGRAGFELVQKAVSAGVGSLVSVGAPTSLSADLARQAGLALYGFTSARRTVRYT
ncbi:MAG: formate dehydrogenase accessory sulfurtransferase FdhD [Nocardioides sp.]